jgi:hypothetical protein
MADIETFTFDTTETLWAAIQLARATARQTAFQKGHYGNSLERHLVGMLGQIAVEQWATRLDILATSVFRDFRRTAECDVLLRSRSPLSLVRVEVKSWSRAHWPELGRCVAVDQMQGVLKKADAIVLAVLDDDGAVPSATVLGWSTPKELAETAPRLTGHGKDKDKVNNHQVEPAVVRALAELTSM